MFNSVTMLCLRKLSLKEVLQLLRLRELFPKPAIKNNEANTTIIKISSELILSNLFNKGVAFLATIKNRSMYPKAIPIEVRAPKNEA